MVKKWPDIKETLLFYNFTFKLTILCLQLLTIYLWHEAHSIYTVLWHTLLCCHIDTRCINSIDWRLHSCFDTVFTSWMRQKKDNNNLLASLF